MNKILFFGAGVVAGYFLSKTMSASGPGSPVPDGIENGGVVSGRRRWVHVDAYRRHYPGMGAIAPGPIHTVIVPPNSSTSIRSNNNIGYSNGLM